MLRGKYTYRLVVFVVLLAVLLLSVGNTVAQPMVERNDNISVIDIANNVLPDYLTACGYELLSDYYLSNQYIILNSNSQSVLFFVFSEEECIGELIISTTTGNSCFLREKCEIVTELFCQQVKVNVVSDGHSCIRIVTGDEETSVSLYGEDLSHTISSNTTVDLMPITIQHKIRMTDEHVRQDSTRYAVYDSNYIDVPFQANATAPDSGYGLCWIASAISLIKYKGCNVVYTTVGFYQYYKYNYPFLPSNYPTGNRSDTVKCFDLYNLSVSGGNWGLYYNSVKNLIDNGKPILAGIGGTVYGLTIGHVVVVCGYEKFSHEGLTFYYYYRLMDPNCTNYVIASSNPSSTNFTYNNGSEYYTTWDYCIY